MAIEAQNIVYSAAGEEMVGYIARDTSHAGDGPGVMVVHEWWGLDDYIRGRARMLAEAGYTALAVDMYGGGRTADNPADAGAAMNAVLGDMDTGTKRLQAGCALLASQDDVDPSRLAAMGYCFGGAAALHCARIGMDLKAVVSFHGALGSFHKPEPGSVKARILVGHGAADALVPDEDVAAFKAEMDDARADYTFMALDGALHGFTNPEATGRGEKYGLPLAYDEAADKASWDAMLELFRRTLG